MGRVKDNAEILGKLKNNIRSKDLMECQVEMLNQIRCLLADISRSLAVIADCNNLESMSVVDAGKEIQKNCENGKENSDG